MKKKVLSLALALALCLGLTVRIIILEGDGFFAGLVDEAPFAALLHRREALEEAVAIVINSTRALRPL